MFALVQLSPGPAKKSRHLPLSSQRFLCPTQLCLVLQAHKALKPFIATLTPAQAVLFYLPSTSHQSLQELLRPTALTPLDSLSSNEKRAGPLQGDALTEDGISCTATIVAVGPKQQSKLTLQVQL